MAPHCRVRQCGQWRKAKAQVAAAVGDDHQAATQTGRVQGLHPGQPPDHARAQSGHWVSAHPAQEVVQGLIHRPALLVGLRQAIEIGQHGRAIGVQLVVQLPATAQLAQEQPQAPPQQEALVIDDEGGVARIGDGAQPLVELSKEMADRLDEPRADGKGRPRRRWRCWTWVRTRARLLR